MIDYRPCHDRDVWVHMTSAEIDAAIRHGVKMRRASIVLGHKHHEGYNPDDKKSLRVQCLGSLCEAIVNLALGFDVDLTSETYNVPDLPNKTQVRLIGREWYGLRVYPRRQIGDRWQGDEADWRIVGVVVPMGLERVSPYRIPGWITARDGRRPEWQMAPHGRPPMWAVPQQELVDLRDYPLEDEYGASA